MSYVFPFIDPPVFIGGWCKIPFRNRVVFACLLGVKSIFGPGTNRSNPRQFLCLDRCFPVNRVKIAFAGNMRELIAIGVDGIIMVPQQRHDIAVDIAVFDIAV